jgi:hypothetical protein
LFARIEQGARTDSSKDAVYGGVELTLTARRLLRH